MSIRALNTPLEKHQQMALFDWLGCTRYQNEPIGKYAFAIPNASKLFGTAGQRSALMASMKRQGLRTGIPDLMIAIPVAPHHGLYVELKRDAKSQVGDEQVEWRDRLRRQGYRAEIAVGYEAAVAVIKTYLELPT